MPSLAAFVCRGSCLLCLLAAAAVSSATLPRGRWPHGDYRTCPVAIYPRRVEQHQLSWWAEKGKRVDTHDRCRVLRLVVGHRLRSKAWRPPAWPSTGTLALTRVVYGKHRRLMEDGRGTTA